MSLYIGVYVYFQIIEAPLPAFLPQVNTWVNWGLLLWAGYQSGKIIVDCVQSHAKNQMTTDNMWNGILLALLHALPTVLMALFMLREGFVGK
ncbi:MAG: hypothetical protein IT260_13600 [Saprospiraceae bacterium]|nr:hypothetical protein [Saprospiraceae bacterium]